MERQLFDVLVCDVGMSQMDGYSLIIKVRPLLEGWEERVRTAHPKSEWENFNEP